MPRIRSVHPELFTDEAFVQLSMPARLLCIGLWTQADDRGVFEWKPIKLKMALFSNDSVNVLELMEELLAQRCIMKFEDSGKEYGVVRNFCVYQRPKMPSYRHPFPQRCASFTGFGSDKLDQLFQRSPSTREKSPQLEKKERKKEESLLITNTESSERERSTHSLSEKSFSEEKKESGLPGPLTPLPPDWLPSTQLQAELSATYGISEDSIKIELVAFHARCSAAGTLSPNWNSTFTLWIKRWHDHQQKLAAKTAPPRIELSKTGPATNSSPTSNKPEPRHSSALWKPSEHDWEGACALFAKTGTWSAQFGPDPSSANCRAPRAILEAHQINSPGGTV
jgi:hypothetical protein